jgi:hypothetical protein
MDIISNASPQVRLLTSAALDVVENSSSDEESTFALKGSGIFSGKGRWIFIGILLGALIISAAGLLFSRHEQSRWRPPPPVPKLFSVTTRNISSSPNSSATPGPVLIQIRPESLRVTAISLGHPRLAIINGTQLSEGDYLTVHTAGAAIVVRLKVLKIADGRIDLQNGTQLICARLMVAGPEEKSEQTRYKD